MGRHFSNLLLNMQATYCYIGELPLVVRKETVSEVFARNLASAMQPPIGHRVTQMELARRTGIGQSTISLYLRPDARNPAERPPSPTLEGVAAIAKALGTEPWLLIHPDPEQAQRAQALIYHVRQDATPPRLSGLAVHQPYVPYGRPNEQPRKRSSKK